MTKQKQRGNITNIDGMRCNVRRSEAKIMKKESSVIRKLKDRKVIAPAVSLSLALSFMIFMYAPMELYFENKTEYWFDIRHLFPICLMMFSVMFAVSVLFMLVVGLIHEKLYHIVTALYLILYLCTYVQGNYLVSDLPPLDGSFVPWDLYDYQRKYCIILWVVVAAAILLLWKFARTKGLLGCAKWLPAGITAVLAFTLVVVGITNHGFDRKLSIAASTDYELEMSTDRNFVIMVVDTVDGGKLEQMLGEHPEYSEAMKDFTYYGNAMSMYPYTYFSVPYILSGDRFECDEYIDDYMIRAYGNAPLLDKLEGEGYRLGLYEADMPLTDECMYRFENIKDVDTEFTSVVDFIKVQMRLVGLKYAPYDLKKRCLVLPEEIPALRKQVNDIEYAQFDYSNMQLYADLQNKGITYTDDKCFRFIHIEGAHVPFRYNENLEIAENSNYETCMEATMKVVMAYVQALKDSGVYDNTAIVITADHGYNYEDDASYTPEKRQHACLFVKGIGEQHDEMILSEAPISHEDFKEAYLRLLDGADSSEVFDYKDGDYRERKYLFHYLWDRDHMDEYVQTGHASDDDSLKLTGVRYSQ